MKSYLLINGAARSEKKVVIFSSSFFLTVNLMFSDFEKLEINFYSLISLSLSLIYPLKSFINDVLSKAILLTSKFI